MPIQRTLKDLEIFCIQLLDKGFKKDIGIYNLRYEIADKFGYSAYIQKSTMKALMEFKLLKETAPGRFKITVLEKKEDKEKEAMEELNKKFG